MHPTNGKPWDTMMGERWEVVYEGDDFKLSLEVYAGSESEAREVAAEKLGDTYSFGVGDKLARFIWNEGKARMIQEANIPIAGFQTEMTKAEANARWGILPAGAGQ